MWLSSVALLLAAGVAAEEAPALAAQEREQQAIFERVAPSVVFVAQAKGFGSGFFVSSDGLVLTNAHVVGAAKEVSVVLRDGRRLVGEVVEKGSEHVDLALVKVPVTGVPALALDEAPEVRVGSFVASVGHGEGAIWTFNTGLVSNVYPVGAEKPVFQTQIPLNPGNSGGPVVDRLGRVVGVVTSGIEGSNSINFAIRSDVAPRVLSKLAEKANVLVVLAPANVPVFLDGAPAGQGPRLVLAPKPGEREIFAVIGGRMDKRKIAFPAVKYVDFNAPAP